jgi:transposase
MSRLDGVTADDLRAVLSAVDGKDATRRVMVALNYVSEDGLTQAELAERYGMSVGWVSRWLDRLERLADEPYESVVYDEPRAGRPTELAPASREQFLETLRGAPPEDAWDAWTVPRACGYLADEFDGEFSPRHVRRLLREAGLSWTTVQSTGSDAEGGDSDDGDDAPRTVWTLQPQS